MRNSIMEQIQDGIESVRNSLSGLFNNDNQSSTNRPICSIFDNKANTIYQNTVNINDKSLQKQKQDQLSLSQIMSMGQLNVKKDSSQKKQVKSIRENIKQAIRNSTIARNIYHQEQPQKQAQLFMNDNEYVNDLEEQSSLGSCSSYLRLKTSKQEIKPQTKQSNCIEGILYKYSPSFFGAGSQRYCSLRNTQFIYRENKNQYSPIAGILNFNLLSFSIVTRFQKTKVERFDLKVDNGQKQFIFKAQNQEKTFEWYTKILKTINCSQGKRLKMTSLSNYNRFWRKDYIAERQFRQHAQTGDILLFRGKKTSAILQRKMTMEQYDHIGVILLNSFGQLLIFQANGGLGVGLCPWKKFIKNKWYQDQQIVATRQLHVQRTPEFLTAVSNFVEKNIGKKYNFSFKEYLISRHSTVDSEKQSFFCSSLVAKLYKKLGFLQPSVSSNRYMPYDFSQKQNIQLLNKGPYNHSSLGPQKIILFDNNCLTKN